jgi:hypothetical protein
VSGKKAKAARRQAHPATDHPAFERTHEVTDAADHTYLPATFTISEWHPLPGGQGRPAAVCIIVAPAPELGLGDVRFVVRLKSKAAVQAMIDVLADHRNSVFGDT